MKPKRPTVEYLSRRLIDNECEIMLANRETQEFIRNHLITGFRVTHQSITEKFDGHKRIRTVMKK